MTIQKQEWSDRTRYLIIHNSGSVFLDVYPEVQDSFGGTAFIWGLYVDKHYRRKGIGRILLEEAERYAQHEGHRSVVMDWELKDTPREVLEWYLRSGYTVVGNYREETYTLEKNFVNV